MPSRTIITHNALVTVAVTAAAVTAAAVTAAAVTAVAVTAVAVTAVAAAAVAAASAIAGTVLPHRLEGCLIDAPSGACHHCPPVLYADKKAPHAEYPRVAITGLVLPVKSPRCYVRP